MGTVLLVEATEGRTIVAPTESNLESILSQAVSQSWQPTKYGRH